MLAGCANDAILDVGNARAATVDRDDQHGPIVLADGFQRLVGTRCGRLVDGINHIDVRAFLEQRLHGGTAAIFGPAGHFMPANPGIIFVAVPVRIFHIDAEAFHEALVTQVIHGGLVHRQIEHGDLGVGGLVAERTRSPLADQSSGLAIIGGKGRVGGINRIKRSVEHDDQQAGVTRLLDGGHDGAGIRGDNGKALGARSHQVFDGGYLAVIVAIELAGKRA